MNLNLSSFSNLGLWETGSVLCGILGVARSSGHPQRGVLSDYRKNKHIFSMPLPITHIAVLLALVAIYFSIFHFGPSNVLMYLA